MWQLQPESRVAETETEDDSKSGKIHLLKSLRVGAIGPEAGAGLGAGLGVGAGEHKSLNDMRQNVQVTIQPAARLIREDLFLQARQGKDPTMLEDRLSTNDDRWLMGN